MTKFVALAFASLAVMTSAAGYGVYPTNNYHEPSKKVVHEKSEYSSKKCKTGANGVQPHDLVDVTGECRCPAEFEYDHKYQGCVLIEKSSKKVVHEKSESQHNYESQSKKCKTGANGVQPHDLLDVTGECRCPAEFAYDYHYQGCVLIEKSSKPHYSESEKTYKPVSEKTYKSVSEKTQKSVSEKTYKPVSEKTYKSDSSKHSQSSHSSESSKHSSDSKSEHDYDKAAGYKAHLQKKYLRGGYHW